MLDLAGLGAVSGLLDGRKTRYHQQSDARHGIQSRDAGYESTVGFGSNVVGLSRGARNSCIEREDISSFHDVRGMMMNDDGAGKQLSLVCMCFSLGVIPTSLSTSTICDWCLRTGGSWKDRWPSWFRHRCIELVGMIEPRIEGFG